MNYTISLSSRGDSASVKTLGGKGYNLIVLAQGDFKVPNAFIVSEEAFREYRSQWSSTIDIDNGDNVDDQRIEDIRLQFDKYDLKYELTAEINNQLHDLIYSSPIRNPLLAVRSSGIDEDLDTVCVSGINDTVLNVNCDLVSVCDAIKQCWRSLFTRHAITYRQSNGFPALNTSIAVIIQVMIPSESSGIAFTADPQTGSRAHISLDGVKGMGETLVRSLVKSDHFLLRKPYGDRCLYIEERKLRKQEYQYMSNYPKNGTTRIDIKDDEYSSCFTDNELILIGNSVIEIEKYFQKPMNILFTLYMETVYILQARPITNLLSIPKSINPLIYPYNMEWSCFVNIGNFQLLSDPITPMGYSLFKKISGLSEKYLIHVSGYVFVNLSGLLETCLLHRITLSILDNRVNKEMCQIIREAYTTDYNLYFHNNARIANKRIKLLFCKPIIKNYLHDLWNNSSYEEIKREIKDIINKQLLKVAELQAILDTDLSTSHLTELFSVSFDIVDMLLRWSRCSHYCAKSRHRIISLLNKYGFSEVDAETLWTRLPENIDIRMNDFLYQLGYLLDEMGLNDRITELSLARDISGTHALIYHISQMDSPAAIRFTALWPQFLDEFGCCSHGDIDIGRPRYDETPFDVLNMAMIAKNEQFISEEKSSKLREDAVEKFGGKMSSHHKHKFLSNLPLAQLYVTYKEHPKYIFVRLLSVIRKSLSRLGKVLVKQDLIDEVEDVFFLQLEDALWYDERKVNGDDFRERIRESKEINNKAKTYVMPRVICGPECCMSAISKHSLSSQPNVADNVMQYDCISQRMIEECTAMNLETSGTNQQKDVIVITKTTNSGCDNPLALSLSNSVEEEEALTHGSVDVRKVETLHISDSNDILRNS